MRLVIVSDTHNQLARLSIPDGDVFVHCGDFSNIGSVDEIVHFNECLKRLPHRHKVVVAGNHDIMFERRPEDARRMIDAACYLQDQETTIDGVKFYGSPWSPEFGFWAFGVPVNSTRMENIWKKVPDDTDVLITHGPPFSILDKNSRGKSVGCELLLRRTKAVKPKVHCFGHIHESYGIDDRFGIKFVNAASLKDYTGTLFNEPIVIDI